MDRFDSRGNYVETATLEPVSFAEFKKMPSNAAAVGNPTGICGPTS